MRTHIKVLGAIHIAFGVLGIFVGLAVLLFFGGLAGLVAMEGPASDAVIAAPILGGLGGIAFVLALVLSVPSVLAGIGLMRFRGWGRILAIVLSVIELFQIPFGTALGVYGLWALLSREGAALFERGQLLLPVESRKTLN